MNGNLNDKFALIHEHWRPKVIAQLNGQEVRLVTFLGVFPWHHHENEDEMFLVWREVHGAKWGSALNREIQ